MNWAHQGDTNSRKVQTDSQIPEDEARLGLRQTDRNKRQTDREPSSSARKTEEWQRAFSTWAHRGPWEEVPGTLSGYEVV